jgi:heme-degrading monooxygenase HmoA
MSTHLLHTVMWRLQGAPQERAQHAKRCIEAFTEIKQAASDLPGLLDMQIASNDEAINASADAWHLVLVTRFASSADLAQYNMHPLHLTIKEVMAPIKRARAVVDAWVE